MTKLNPKALIVVLSTFVLGLAVNSTELHSQTQPPKPKKRRLNESFYREMMELNQSLPANDKSELTEMILNVSGLSRDFDDVADRFVWANDSAGLRAAVEALKQVDPDNRFIIRYTARAEIIDKRYAEGVAMLESEFEFRDEKADQCVSLAMMGSIMSREPVKLFKKLPKWRQPKAFDFLAESMMINGYKFDDVVELIDEYKQVFPESGLGDYHLGELNFFYERYADAERAYMRAVELGAENKDDIRKDRIRCWYFLGKSLDAYKEFPPSDDAFNLLAYMHVVSDTPSAEKRGQALLELIKLHETESKETVELKWKLHAHWLVGNYETISTLSEGHTDELLDPAPQFRLFDDILVRSLVRAKHFDSALSLATKIAERTENPWYVAMVHAAKGEADETGKILEEVFRNTEYRPGSVVYDADFSIALQQEAFAGLRKKLLADDSLKGLVLLTSRGMLPSAEQTIKIAEKAWGIESILVNSYGKAETPDDNFLAEDEEENFFLQFDGLGIAISFNGLTRFFPEPDRMAKRWPDPEIGKRIVEHKAWIVVKLRYKPDDWPEDKAYLYLGKLIAEFGKDGQPLLVMSLENGSIALVNDQLLQELQRDEPRDAIKKNGVEFR